MSAPPEPAGCAWTDRAVANKFYPDVAVPIELVPGFTVSAGNNQSIWVDVYIPKTTAAGTNTGTVTIRENGVSTHTVPIRLKVRNFVLPDSPNSKTMLYSDSSDLSPRYGDAAALQAFQNEVLVAHRHKISMIDGDNMGAGWTVGAPAAQYGFHSWTGAGLASRTDMRVRRVRRPATAYSRSAPMDL